jgi:hypothetical protein
LAETKNPSGRESRLASPPLDPAQPMFDSLRRPHAISTGRVLHELL